MCACVCVGGGGGVQVCMPVFVQSCMHAHIFVYTCVLRVCESERLSVCTYECVCACVYTSHAHRKLETKASSKNCKLEELESTVDFSDTIN